MSLERFFDNDVVRGTLDRAVPEQPVAVLSLQMPGRANKVNEAFLKGLHEALSAAREVEGLAGIVLSSGHRDFCVGADLEMILAERDPARIYAMSMAFHRLHRELETGGIPVAVALTGSALGGGYELALACHHLVAWREGRVQLGLPEAQLGLLPGGGGTQRLPRRIGIQPALELILQGRITRAPKALAAGLVDALADTPEQTVQAAVDWTRANPQAQQPWDSPRFRWPGPRPTSADGRNLFLAASAMTFKKTAGAMASAEAAISAVHEGALIRFDRALEVEARHFARVAVSDQAKDMIRTLFFHKQAADKQVGLPQAESDGFRRVAVLGAGMMGAGLAFLCANAGYEVVLRDLSDEAITRAMAHIRDTVGSRLKHRSEEERQAVLDRITPTIELQPIEGCDLVIEAVFEDLELKHRVIREVEPLLAPGAIFASNTSALPITDLAKASADPTRFIGLHFFSPVEKMPLLEIVRGAETSEQTLARSLAFARALKKTVIAVNDGYGFYTSRVFAAYILEGAQLVAEGHDPVRVEWAARAAGMVVPPLQVFDEVSLKLGQHALTQAASYQGEDPAVAPGVKLIFDMVERKRRLGRAHGAGFYDYVKGRRQGIWSGLQELTAAPPEVASVEALGERLLLVQVATALRCLDEGILRTPRDAEVGAVLGIGFAPQTGGPLAYVDRRGAAETLEALNRLQASHGARFAPARVLKEQAARGERFFPEPPGATG